MHTAQVKRSVSVLVSVASRLNMQQVKGNICVLVSSAAEGEKCSCVQHRLGGMSESLPTSQDKGNVSVLVHSRD